MGGVRSGSLISACSGDYLAKRKSDTYFDTG